MALTPGLLSLDPQAAEPGERLPGDRSASATTRRVPPGGWADSHFWTVLDGLPMPTDLVASLSTWDIRGMGTALVTVAVASFLVRHGHRLKQRWAVKPSALVARAWALALASRENRRAGA